MNRIHVALIALAALTVLAPASSAQTGLPAAATHTDDAALIQAGQNAAAHDLKDPDSAKFRDTEINGAHVCGEINATNSFGAYVGYRPFYAVRREDGVWAAGVSNDDISRDDVSWCLTSLNSKSRDNEFFHNYGNHRCSKMDAGFQLLYSAFCPLGEPRDGGKVSAPITANIVPHGPRLSQDRPPLPADRSSYRISADKYLAVQIGMTYEQVLYIVGFQGNEINSTDIGRFHLATDIWKNSDESALILVFRDGILFSKAQSGLR